jgi:hypothetical protein
MTEQMDRAPLKERMEGREYAHRAKGQNFDADLLAEAATEIEALRARCAAMEAALLGLIRWSRDEVESQIGRECKSRDLPREWHKASAALGAAK